MNRHLIFTCFFSLVLFSLTLLSGCASKPNKPEVEVKAPVIPVEEIIPFGLNSVWHYRMEGEGASDLLGEDKPRFQDGYVEGEEMKLIAPDPVLDRSYKIISSYIEKSEVVDDVRWYLMNDNGRKVWVRNTHDGVVEAEAPNLNADLVMKIPFAEGEVYKTSSGSVEVQTCLAPIQVPAGKFSCVKYSFSGDDGNFHIDYLVPKLGVVKRELYKGGEVKVQVLSVYRIK